MSDTVDLTLMSNLVRGVDRELRLLRLQLDNLAPRFAVMERSFHDLVAEVARGFGQAQQQMTRQEKRIDAVDAGFATLRAELAESTARIIRTIEASA